MQNSENSSAKNRLKYLRKTIKREQYLNLFSRVECIHLSMLLCMMPRPPTLGNILWVWSPHHLIRVKLLGEQFATKHNSMVFYLLQQKTTHRKIQKTTTFRLKGVWIRKFLVNTFKKEFFGCGDNLLSNCLQVGKSRIMGLHRRNRRKVLQCREINGIWKAFWWSRTCDSNSSELQQAHNWILQEWQISGIFCHNGTCLVLRFWRTLGGWIITNHETVCGSRFQNSLFDFQIFRNASCVSWEKLSSMRFTQLQKLGYTRTCSEVDASHCLNFTCFATSTPRIFEHFKVWKWIFESTWSTHRFLPSNIMCATIKPKSDVNLYFQSFNNNQISLNFFGTSSQANFFTNILCQGSHPCRLWVAHWFNFCGFKKGEIFFMGIFLLFPPKMISERRFRNERKHTHEKKVAK